MLKLALSLVALLALASPSFAKPKVEPAPKAICLTPEALTASAPYAVQYRIAGSVLAQFRATYEMVSGQKTSDSVDLILIFGDPGDKILSVISFKNGCRIGSRVSSARSVLNLLNGGGTI